MSCCISVGGAKTTQRNCCRISATAAMISSALVAIAALAAVPFLPAGSNILYLAVGMGGLFSVISGYFALSILFCHKTCIFGVSGLLIDDSFELHFYRFLGDGRIDPADCFGIFRL